MLARLTPARKFAARLFAIMSFLWLAACDGLPTLNQPGSGPTVDTSKPVQVALLVPGGSSDPNDATLAAAIENGARLAVADLNGAQIDLRVYNTASDPAQAARVALLAANEGAKIILGPLRAEESAAAGVAVSQKNVNLLSFSNTATIAGGNVFVLGNTFDNTAGRLVNYATRSGLSRIAVVHGDDPASQIGRDAIVRAIQRNGAQVAGVASYPLSQQGIISATSDIVSTVRQGGANAVFLTAGPNADLPILATTLPEAGLSPSSTKYIGLTGWNLAPQMASLPGLQGGLFAVPDEGLAANFANRYAATYGGSPHPLAGLAYDGVAAVGALIASGNRNALTKDALTTPQGFQGTAGIFRLLPSGLNEKGLAIATIRNGATVILERAPRSFAGGS